MKLFKKNSDSDKKLNDAVHNLPQGSAEAFRFLFNKYREKIYIFCLKMLHDSDAAQDAFQETFIKIFEHRFEFEGQNFQAWAYRIARNTCLNMLKQQKEVFLYNEDYIAPVIDNVLDFTLEQAVNKAVENLPHDLKEVFIMREYDGLQYKDIAEILGIEMSLAKVRAHRARLKLQEQLEPLIQK